jgi:hypothetical protein
MLTSPCPPFTGLTPANTIEVPTTVSDLVADERRAAILHSMFVDEYRLSEYAGWLFPMLSKFIETGPDCDELEPMDISNAVHFVGRLIANLTELSETLA